MGDVEIEIEIDGTERIIPAIREGVREGLEDTGNYLMEQGEEQAKDQILAADRVWRRSLKEGFTSSERRFNRWYHWKGDIKNEAPHASLNERGLKPGSNPPVQKIIPWVDDELGNTLPEVSSIAPDVQNWDPELQALAAQYSPGQVLTSFAIKESLEDEGYQGIGFMETTEQYLQKVGQVNIKHIVEKNLEEAFRKYDLK